ncbi:hypothetical protein BOTNAR_0616g00010 [Botryotinia narcissicola]|uniref:Uncharacterized protein n=1 Tax=Botryotinia narcissicola TaxID=278944 RepID=A0A4Z1HAH9_9HELO|nr:hypothetical protein BOTNAR_0616g00010 [Botryotinia narcissicola]
MSCHVEEINWHYPHSIPPWHDANLLIVRIVQSNNEPEPMVRPPPLPMRIIELMASAPARLDKLRAIGKLFRIL